MEVLARENYIHYRVKFLQIVQFISFLAAIMVDLNSHPIYINKLTLFLQFNPETSIVVALSCICIAHLFIKNKVFKGEMKCRQHR